MNPHDHLKLQTAMIAYDNRQKRGKRYNPHALAIYCRALHEVDSQVSSGIGLGQALASEFQGSLLTAMGKAVGIKFDFDKRGRVIAIH